VVWDSDGQVAVLPLACGVGVKQVAVVVVTLMCGELLCGKAAVADVVTLLERLFGGRSCGKAVDDAGVQ